MVPASFSLDAKGAYLLFKAGDAASGTNVRELIESAGDVLSGVTDVAWAVLNDLQDFVCEVSTAPWPQWHDSVGQLRLLHPHVAVEADTLTLSFGDQETDYQKVVAVLHLRELAPDG